MKLILDNDTELVIELLDSPLIQDWAKHLSTLKMYPTEVSNLVGYPEVFDEEAWLINLINLLQEIKSFTDDNPVILDYKLYNQYNTQQLCNQAHRWAVYTVTQEYKKQNICTHSIQQLGYINHLCHVLEFSVPREIDWPDTCCNNLWDISFDCIDRWDMTPEWRELISTQRADVYMAKRILGKDLREAYRDQDDPTAFDIQTVGDQISWAIEVDPFNKWQDLYNDPKFIEYTKHSTQPKGKIPVGNISGVFDTDIINKRKVKEVIL